MRLQRYPSRYTRPRRPKRTCLSTSLLTLALLSLSAVLFSYRHSLGEALLALSAPQHSDPLKQARLSFERGDLSGALHYAQASLAQQARNNDALALAVRALVYRSYAELGREADRATALELTQYALSQRQYDREVWAIHAFALQANRRMAEAQRAALRVLEGSGEQRHDILARISLALTYSAQGLFEAGLREADKALALAQERAQVRPAPFLDWRMDALRARAIILSDLGRYAEARQTVEQALNLHWRLAALHYEKALYALQMGDRDSATAAYFSVLAFDADNGKARLRLCSLSSDLGEREAALAYCEAGVAHLPDYHEGYFQLGREYYLKGNFAAARDAFGECARLQVVQGVPISQRKLECWTLQGQAAEALGDCDTLLKAYANFQRMAQRATLAQAWVYPPEGPAICQSTPVPS